MITELTSKAIAYTVAKDAHSFRVVGRCLYMQLTGPEHYLNEYYDEEQLPEGNWEILGRPEEMGEEQKKTIVEMQKTFGFRKYDAHSGDYQWCASADQSFDSLLKSKNINPESVIILIKKQ